MLKCILITRDQLLYLIHLVAGEVKRRPRHHVWHVASEIDLDKEGRISGAWERWAGLEDPTTDQDRPSRDPTLLRHHVVLVVVRAPGVKIIAIRCFVENRVNKEITARNHKHSVLSAVHFISVDALLGQNR